MARRLVPVLMLVFTTAAHADIRAVANCQRAIAREGAKFAKLTIQATLKCTNAVSECQIQCEQGVFGPPCSGNPPPCCDPDDPDSNATFAACLAAADIICAAQTERIARYEATKQTRIITLCNLLTPDELCGAQAEGLNFATLNAGCLALDPNYTCNVPNLVACLGGPLQRALIDQISATLSPRASDAVATLNLQAAFPDIPVPQKVNGTVAAGNADVYEFAGNAGDEVVVRVRTRDDTGASTSLLHAALTLLGPDGTPVANVNVNDVPCGVPTVCGAECPIFRRTLPLDATFRLAVRALPDGPCTGGKYKLVIVGRAGSAPPVLVGDDVPASSITTTTSSTSTTTTLP
jgi:hypothetical protein